MVIERDSLRYGFYAAAIAFILALTGIFTAFETRDVIANRLNLSAVLLAIALGGAGYYAAGRVLKNHDLPTAMVNGALSSLVVGAALGALVVLEANIDMGFVFPDLDPLAFSTLTLGEDVMPGVALLLGVSVAIGAFAGLLLAAPARPRRVVFLSLATTAILGLLQNQIRNVITLPDALAISAVLGATYVAGQRIAFRTLTTRLMTGIIIGAGAGVVLTFIANASGESAFLHGSGSTQLILGRGGTLEGMIVLFIAVFALAGLSGTLITGAPRNVHHGGLFFAVTILLLGVLNWQGRMNILAAALFLVLLMTAFWLSPPLGDRAEQHFDAMRRGPQRNSRYLASGLALVVLLAAPSFVGQYITSVLDLVGLFIIMGIGLNVMIGYAGLLDLGYVASFAIGAYTAGILMTPSLVTCGVDPRAITPETTCHILSFWAAWPIAVIVSALTGALLGVPVLRLRGDYLAIVTLGFGQIMNLLVKSNDLKPLFGSAQGITPIPFPVIDLTFINENLLFELKDAKSIYYLFLFSVILAAFVVSRLATSRLGRAWRAIRADEDVAEAMGIHLVGNKLMAFGVSSAFAGLGGAVFGTWLQGIFPDSFSIAVSINVVSLIIIGGLGSIPGVVLGSLVLVGMPEALRELQNYRLLGFGVLLVVTMLLKPDGLLPPKPRELTGQAEETHRQSEQAREGYPV